MIGPPRRSRSPRSRSIAEPSDRQEASFQRGATRSGRPTPRQLATIVHDNVLPNREGPLSRTSWFMVVLGLLLVVPPLHARGKRKKVAKSAPVVAAAAAAP